MQPPLRPDERLVLEALLELRERDGEELGGLLSLNAATAAIAREIGQRERGSALTRLMGRKILLAEMQLIPDDPDGRRYATYLLDRDEAQQALDVQAVAPGPRGRLSAVAC